MIQSVKGFNDILPDLAVKWRRVEDEARNLLEVFGFSEIRLPIVERLELFQRGIGVTTDIVEKEMYTFQDRKGVPLALRPEGTASVVRAYIEHGLYHKDPVAKLYYMGPMFRYERPQKGRARQFYQVGAEVLGVEDPRVDAEVLDMLTLFFDRLGIEDVELFINSLGCEECRPSYREALLRYLEERKGMLCRDCQRRLELNPLRVLDCKVEGCREATKDAPCTKDFLCHPCAEHFEKIKDYLNLLGVPYRINPRMVRGLDYYTKTAFEMVCNRLGSQNAVAAGGRYDRLVKDLGGPDTPGFGFAIGIERTVLLLKEEEDKKMPSVYLISMGGEASAEALRLLKELRMEGIQVELAYGEKSLKSHMRRANKLGVSRVLILGEDELRKGTVIVKDMKRGVQGEIGRDKVVSSLKLDTSPSTSHLT